MTENNAAHQNYLAAHRAVSEVLEANSVFVGGKTINAIVDAALSKLRAEGVQAGDERALFEWHNRACELTRDEDVPDEYRNSHVQECWNGWKDRAALASAEETRPAARVAGDDASRYLEWDKNRSAWEMPVGTPLFYGNRSPVADESPMAKMADALREKARQERKAYQDSRVQTTEWGPMSAGTEADDPLAPWLRWRMAWRASRATRTPRWPPRISAPRLPGWQAPQASEAVRIHNDAIKAAAKVCADIARQYDPQNNQEHALASELYSAALAIRKLEKDNGDCAKGAVVPSEPLRVFSAGMWTYDGTGQAFSHTDLDAAAFVTYRDALSTPSVVKQSLTATQTGEKGESDAN